MAQVIQCKSLDMDEPIDEIVLAIRLRKLVIELSSQMKERPMKLLLDSGVIGNFISDMMATTLELKIISNMDFQDLTLANGPLVCIAGYVQFTMNYGGCEGKSSPRYFPMCQRSASWECLGWCTRTPSLTGSGDKS